MHYHFGGTLTERDAKQHLALPFTMPDSMTNLLVRFEYAPARVPTGRNALHLSLFDSRGFRGAGHRRGERQADAESYTIELSQAHATPGYTAGPLPPGEWSVVIDSHMILPDAPISYQLLIDISSAPGDAVAPLAPPAALAPRGPGWYRGDLHAHTLHSDGAWQIADLLAAAGTYRLDFATLSDHNTVSGLAEFERRRPADLLTIGGLELTTYSGHALALGVREWVDWRVRPGERSMPQIAAEVAAAGGLFIIAHPMSVGDPICTGCDWRYSDMLPGPARIIEVWNGGAWANDESNNENALALWYVWLNQGHRLVATAGTDAHGPAPDGVRPGFNVVYAEAFSASAILQAVALGHVYLSDGPQLEFSARSTGGVMAIMGDRLPADRATVRAGWRGCSATDIVRLIVDGQPLTEQAAGTHGEWQSELAPGQARWCLLELRASSGHLRAVTNPIFFGE
jgi:hypothetical protein